MGGRIVRERVHYGLFLIHVYLHALNKRRRQPPQHVFWGKKEVEEEEELLPQFTLLK